MAEILARVWAIRCRHRGRPRHAKNEPGTHRSTELGDAVKKTGNGVKKTVRAVSDGFRNAVGDVRDAVKDGAKKMSDAAKPKASNDRRRVVDPGPRAGILSAVLACGLDATVARCLRRLRRVVGDSQLTTAKGLLSAI